MLLINHCLQLNLPVHSIISLNKDVYICGFDLLIIVVLICLTEIIREEGSSPSSKGIVIIQLDNELSYDNVYSITFSPL